MQNVTIQLEELACPSCLQKIEKALKSLDGVNKDSVKVLFNASKAKLDFDEEKVSIESIVRAITSIGYEVKKTQVKSV